MEPPTTINTGTRPTSKTKTMAATATKRNFDDAITRKTWKKNNCMKNRNRMMNGRRVIVLNADNSDENNKQGDDDIDLDIVKDIIRSSKISSDIDGGDEDDDVMFEKVYVGDGDGGLDDLDEATRLELEEGRPSEWMIMKEVCVHATVFVKLGFLILCLAVKVIVDYHPFVMVFCHIPVFYYLLCLLIFRMFLSLSHTHTHSLSVSLSLSLSLSFLSLLRPCMHYLHYQKQP